MTSIPNMVQAPGEPPAPLSPVNVLCVEDSAGDRRLIKEFLSAPGRRVELTFVDSGGDAIDLILRQGKFTEAPVPDWILLDLNLPGRDGHEVLALVKGHPELKHIPVVIFSSSAREDDVRRCYDLQANCYFVKPSLLEDFEKTLGKICDFWARVVRLPHRAKGEPLAPPVPPLTDH